jgi:hypothetical protein
MDRDAFEAVLQRELHVPQKEREKPKITHSLLTRTLVQASLYLNMRGPSPL